jgi:hypothetical protein
MKTKYIKIMLSLFAAIGIFSLSGCGGGGVSDKEITQVCAAKISMTTYGIKQASGMPEGSGKAEAGINLMIAMGLGLPLDIENNVPVDSWNVSVLSRGNAILNSGIKNTSASVGKMSMETVTISEIPAGTKLFPVIYQLVSKDKKHKGSPQEQYFYKDAYGKWQAADPEDAGAKHSSEYLKLNVEFLEDMKAKLKAFEGRPLAVVKAWLGCMQERKGPPDYLQYVSPDYMEDFVTKSLVFTLSFTLGDVQKHGYEGIVALTRGGGGSAIDFVRGATREKIKEAVREIKIIDQKINNESATVTLSGNRVVGLKKMDDGWLITDAPQFLKEGTFNVDRGIPQHLVEGFVIMLQKYANTDYGSDMLFEKVIEEEITKFASQEYKDVLFNEVMGDSKVGRAQWEKETGYSARASISDRQQKAIRKYLGLRGLRRGDDATIAEEINNESAKVTLAGKGGIVNLKKIDGKWLITSIQ